MRVITVWEAVNDNIRDWLTFKYTYACNMRAVCTNWHYDTGDDKMIFKRGVSGTQCHCELWIFYKEIASLCTVSCMKKPQLNKSEGKRYCVYL